jgi:predicted adenine nucleotide alpha hydrolase (AANH) superfamily ATPase
MNNTPKNNLNLLVHTCCAPCSTYVSEKLLQDGFNITGFFYNPNIHPFDEYTRRLEELSCYVDLKKYKLIVKEDIENKWFEAIKGLEHEKEGGRRCEACYRLRLEETALYAKHNNFDGFTTVLTISPHKNAQLINKIGKELEIKYGIYFLEADFKKYNGFKRSIELSKEHNLYRQNYCGCKFSIKK